MMWTANKVFVYAVAEKMAHRYFVDVFEVLNVCGRVAFVIWIVDALSLVVLVYVMRLNVRPATKLSETEETAGLTIVPHILV